jgi:hypothetical protein
MPKDDPDDGSNAEICQAWMIAVKPKHVEQ